MSFLSQLKAQASAVQAAKATAQTQAQADAADRLERTEAACRTTLNYLIDVVQHLNILAPEGPAFSADGKTFWPTMKLLDFQVDSRKKNLHGREVFASIGVGWDIVPLNGKPAPTFVTFVRNSGPGSVAGIPGLSLPSGMTVAGLPVGIELSGPAGGDRRLLAIGAAVEALLPRLPPPPLPA